MIIASLLFEIGLIILLFNFWRIVPMAKFWWTWQEDIFVTLLILNMGFLICCIEVKL